MHAFRCLGGIDPAHDPNRDGEHGPKQGDDDRPDYCVGHPAALADRLRHFSKERQVERRDPLGHNVEQHQRERNQRDDNWAAEHDNDVGKARRQ